MDRTRSSHALLAGGAFLAAHAAAAVSPVATVAAVPTCGGVPAAIVGTPFNDVLFGTPGRDVIVGRGAFDEIHGGGGDGVRVDLATGIATGEGRDTIDGIEFVVGSRFADVIHGDDAELNVPNGEAGENRIYARGGRDAIEGRGGDDLLVGGAGPEWDRLYGGSGHDTCISGHADDCES